MKKSYLKTNFVSDLRILSPRFCHFLDVLKSAVKSNLLGHKMVVVFIGDRYYIILILI